MSEIQEIITKANGPCVVFAGAGTGKTHTIVEKVNYLASKGVYRAESIVCLTFSNEAANNLLIRIRKALRIKEGDKEPIVRTFHGFSADLMRKDKKKKGLDEEIKILTPEEAKVVLHRYFRISPYYCHQYVSCIGTAKDLGIGIEALEDYVKKEEKIMGIDNLEKEMERLDFELCTSYLKSKEAKGDKWSIISKMKRIKDVLALKKFVQTWKAYEKLKEKQGYFDYSDLNCNALKLLKEDKTLAKEFEYVIVDEFQDTNKIQLELLFALVNNRNVSVVGDMNQSIYRFRGAYQHNLQEFKEFFAVKKEDIFNLDKSYRSSNKILRAAHNLIVHNYACRDECFIVENSEGREGEEIKIYELNNAKEEARKVIELIKKELGEDRKHEDICVMFRTHQQGALIKRVLEQEGIPYCAVSKNSLLKQPSVKMIIDYLIVSEKIKNNGKGGEQCWWDIFYNISLQKEDLIKLGRFIKENKDNECLSKVLYEQLSTLPLSPSGRIAVRVIVERIGKTLQNIEGDVKDVLKNLLNVLGFAHEDGEGKGREIFLNLQKLLQLAENHSALYSPDVLSFLNYLEILKNLDIDIEAAEIEQRGIRLMTLHATKGLEYKTVIITNMAQKRFPIEHYGNNSLLPLELSPVMQKLSQEVKDRESLLAFEQHHQLLEERRLCYVAFTRAKEKLILTYAKEYGGRKFSPSQFLEEIRFKENSDIIFEIDSENKYEYEVNDDKKGASFKFLLSANDFELLLAQMIRDNEGDNEKINPFETRAFSPSSLLLFDECQKKFEYKYVYNMPEEKIVAWEAVRLGSFVHGVLEKGVKKNARDLDSFLIIADEMHLEEEWEEIEINSAKQMIAVFFERNKNKFNENSKTEQCLEMQLGGMKFIGFADRIDFNPEGLEIIDYKTNKGQVEPRHRDWQLGFYALAASRLGRVKKVTLEMLKHEKPLVFEIDERGNAVEVVDRKMRFNIYEVEEELVKGAVSVIEAYKNGFKPCPIDKNCEFCQEYVYGV